jgi:hypothetical protein
MSPSKKEEKREKHPTTINTHTHYYYTYTYYLYIYIEWAKIPVCMRATNKCKLANKIPHFFVRFAANKIRFARLV